MESEVTRVLQERPADVGRAGPSSILSSSIWVLVKVFKLICHVITNKETILSTIDPRYGNFN